MLLTPAGAAAQQRGAEEAQLRQLEQSWNNAFLKKDVSALGRILAEDWRGQYPWGNENRVQALAALTSKDTQIQSMVTTEMHVRIFGDLAFIQGSDDERSSFAGKDTSGHYSWTDIFAKRNGRWVAIASQLTAVSK